MSAYQSYLTPVGRKLVSEFASGGAPIELVEFALGSGEAAHSPISTALHREEYRAGVDLVTRPFADKALVQVTAVATAEVGPFWVREIGVYTADGDLFAVSSVPPTFKVQGDGGVTKDLFWRLSLRVVDHDAVALASDPNVAIVSRSELEASEARARDVSPAVYIFHHHSQGNDVNEGKTANAPVKTWARVVELLQPGRRCIVYLLNELHMVTHEAISAPPSCVEFRSHDGTSTSDARRNIRFKDAVDSSVLVGGFTVHGDLNVAFHDVRLIMDWTRPRSPVGVSNGRALLNLTDSQFLNLEDNAENRAIFAMPLGGHIHFSTVLVPGNCQGRIVAGVAAGEDPNATPGLSSNVNSL